MNKIVKSNVFYNNFFPKNRRGLSGIVVTLIIIGIALAAVGIVFYVINAVLEEQEGEVMSASSNVFQSCVGAGYVKIEKGYDCAGTIKYFGGEKCCIGISSFGKKSCLELLDAGFIEDRTYLIDPDGEGTEEPFEVYCDMTTDEGGWTLVGRSHLSCTGDFGWKSTTGSVEDDEQCYSLNVDESGLIFSEILFGIYTSGKNWGAYAYKHEVPSYFLSTYDNSAYNAGIPTPIIGDCSGSITMWNYLGDTGEINKFWARDNTGININYGLLKTSFGGPYANCNQGGNLMGEDGMMFVR